MVNILIFGCTGLVGKTLIKLIELRDFKCNRITLVASTKNKGTFLNVQGNTCIIVEPADTIKLMDLDIIFFCSSSELASKYCPIYLQNNTNCFVIDNSSYYRLHSDIDIIIPPLNKHLLNNNKRIISNSNCTTSGLVMSIYNLQIYGIKQINITSLQSVSGSGYNGINQLNNEQQKKEVLHKAYSKNIYNNVIPLIGELNSEITTEEMKLIQETKKILNNKNIHITALCIRIPIEYCHSLVVNITFENNVTIDELKKEMKKQKGLILMDNIITPQEILNENDVYVCRLRKDAIRNNCFSMFITFNNVLRGASLNSIEIAEELIHKNLLYGKCY